MTKYLSRIALIICLLVSATSGLADTTLINVYDANGNLVSGSGQYYEYNDANQLVRVRQGDQNGTMVAEYFYDSTGRRVKKIENGVVTYYVGKHFEKQVGGSNAGNNSYYFAEGGERVAKKDPAGSINYYHLDHLGGVNVVTNAAGTEVARSDYLPFGDTRQDSAGSDKYGYTGKEKDKTDLYYFEARYNSPSNRHFTQADIADPDFDDPQDLNRYAYVGNNPLSYVDEDGLKKKKKAKLSKREKYLIAHGRDPDKDKTPLKVAKKQEKAKKKALALWVKQHPAVSVQVGTIRGNIETSAIQMSSRRQELVNRANAEAAYYADRAKRYCFTGNNCLSTTTDEIAAWGTGPGTGLLEEQGPLFGWINSHAKKTTNFSASWHEASNYWLTGYLDPTKDNWIAAFVSNVATAKVFLDDALKEAVFTELTDDD